MGTVITRFVYKDIEETIEASSRYSDILTAHNNKYDSKISSDGEFWFLEFKVYDTSRRKNNPGNSKGTRYLPESSTEDN
jgi:hypothetical protein